MEAISITPTQSQTKTELFYGKSILSSVLEKFLGPKILLADEKLSSFADQLKLPTIFLKAGEGAKTKAVQEMVEEKLFSMGCAKETHLLILGGGTLTDLGGYIASIYMRGISHILVPTTLLAMVDAAIGGKTAINTSFGKNMIGTIYHPKAVIIDRNFLESLPLLELFNGLVEICKLGMIYDCSLLKNPETKILEAIHAKIKIIQQDPQDRGFRRILNFGHTIGHALEKACNYQISHGKAVALGCIAESYLSTQLGLLSKQDLQKVQECFPHVQLPAGYRRKDLLQALLSDKKQKEGKVRFVLPEKMGKAAVFDGQYCTAVPDENIDSCLGFLEKQYG